MTIADYETILKTGNIPQPLQDKGLKVVNPTQFLEFRAIIPGNICANRVESIILPTFSVTEKVTIPGKPATYRTVTQNIAPTTNYDIQGASMIATEVASGVFVTGASERKDPDTKQVNIRTEIGVTEVSVGPNNIQLVDGNRVAVVVSGGTQTNIPLSSLTRDQTIALTRGQSIQISIPTTIYTPVTITVA
jgi:hypothetical protein